MKEKFGFAPSFKDDLKALGGSVLGNVLGARFEMKAQLRQRLAEIAHHLNFVSREEFDAAFAMLAQARERQEDLDERLAALEAKMNLSRKREIKSRTKRRLPSINKSNRRRVRK